MHKIFLIGDTGKPKLQGDEVLELLKAKITVEAVNSTVIFLGDNVYPNGLPPESDPKRALAVSRLNAQLDVLKEYKGNVFFISGNHDWNKGRDGGLEYLKRQEKYVEEYLGKGNVYLPDDGMPGPVEKIINDYVRIIFINTQWWIQKGSRPEADEGKFFKDLETLLQDKSRITLMVGHHPMYSKAVHGGNFSYKQHLFPLRVIHKTLFIPLPLAGSLYPLYRKWFGAVEDISYPPYRRMRNKLVSVFEKYENLIYASGHDHNLQYIQREKQHYLISGSGSSSSYVRKGKRSVFSIAARGFIELMAEPEGIVSFNTWSIGKKTGKIMNLSAGKMF